LTYTNLRDKPESKRQQIWQLLSEGNMTPKDIALRLNTTIENVWKEKSLLKLRAGLIVSRRTTQKSKEQSEMIVYHPKGEHEDESSMALQKIKSRKGTGLSNYMIDISQLDSESIMTLYREFKSGKKPIDILAEHGFHPEAVEIEYRRFIELNERDGDELLNRIILNVIQKGYEEEPVRNNNIKTLIDLYRQRGYLTNNEILELLELYNQEEAQSQVELSLLDTWESPPKGFTRLKCGRCNDKIIGVILSEKLYKQLADRCDGKILCDLCWGSTD
jgi:hypothetical protein